MIARFLSFLALAGLASSSVSDCSDGKSLFKVTSMSFSPDPPVVNTNSTLLLTMDVSEEINDGTATYSTFYNYIPFQPTVDPLCETTIPCPIKVGTLDTKSSYPFPNLSGLIEIKIEWADGQGRSLLCVDINTVVGEDNQMCMVGDDEKQVSVYQKPVFRLKSHKSPKVRKSLRA
jgi:hypothetical protein